jgi:hypothetical protein
LNPSFPSKRFQRFCCDRNNKIVSVENSKTILSCVPDPHHHGASTNIITPKPPPQNTDSAKHGDTHVLPAIGRQRQKIVSVKPAFLVSKKTRNEDVVQW